MPLIDPWITLEADQTQMSPQAIHGCDARMGGGWSGIGNPRARLLVWQEPSRYGTIPGSRGFQPSLGRQDTKQAKG